MRTLCALVCVLAAIPFGSSAQETPYRLIDAPPGEPLVRDMVFHIPEHDPLSEQVAFRVRRAFFDTADVPFFYSREGRVVRRSDARAGVLDWITEESLVLVCDVPMGDGEALNLNDPVNRRANCHTEQ